MSTSGVDRGQSVELHVYAKAFRKLDITNCVYSYTIALISSVHDSNLPQLHHRLGLIKLINSLPSAELDLHRQ